MNTIGRGKQVWCGMALALSLLSAPALNAQTPTFSTVFAFDLHQTTAGVVEGSGANQNFLFGTTSDVSLSYGGSIFKVPVGGGAPQIIYQLQASDGYSPQASLLRSSDGFLYGTTRYAPRVGNSVNFGFGTIFKVAQDGSGFQTLHTFNGGDGAFPDLALIEDATYLYGVATSGGLNANGTVYRLRKSDGLFEVLHEFAAVDSTGATATGEGATPSSSLTLASNGRLYGVTSAGGSHLITSTDSGGTGTTTVGTGTIYSLNTAGTNFQTVYQFSALDRTQTIVVNADGVQPSGALLEVSNGVLVGTTFGGGDPHTATVSGYGTVFRFDIATANLNTLYAFDNDTGANPAGQLIKDAASGLVYGITRTGSSTSTPITVYGNIFSIDPITAAFTNQHPLVFSEGSTPSGGLMQANNGDLFGTVLAGNACTAVNSSGYGGVFRYSIATNTNSSAYTNCTQASSSGGGGGAMSPGWLWLLSAFGFAPVVRRGVGFTRR